MEKDIFLPIVWAFYPIGILAVYLTSGEALLLAVPVWFILGVIALILGFTKSTQYRIAYIITGCINVIPILLLFYALRDFGSGSWK